MRCTTHRIQIATKGNSHIVDLTGTIDSRLQTEQLKEGSVTVFVPGSTAAVTTIEYEPGLLKDVPELFDALVPRDKTYHHDETWHDGNGHSHLRASLLGPSLVVPFTNGKLVLGTWQQVVLIDFDNHPRTREIVLQYYGV